MCSVLLLAMVDIKGMLFCTAVIQLYSIPSCKPSREWRIIRVPVLILEVPLWYAAAHRRDAGPQSPDQLLDEDEIPLVDVVPLEGRLKVVRPYQVIEHHDRDVFVLRGRHGYTVLHHQHLMTVTSQFFSEFASESIIIF